MRSVKRFTIWRSVRKVYNMCQVSEEGLPYVRSVNRFTICKVSTQ